MGMTVYLDIYAHTHTNTYTHRETDRGTQIFQSSKSYLTILVAGKVTLTLRLLMSYIWSTYS